MAGRDLLADARERDGFGQADGSGGEPDSITGLPAARVSQSAAAARTVAYQPVSLLRGDCVPEMNRY